MISVVVPVFNAEKTIKDCLKSLEKQTVSRDNYEIIVVDDGSYDQTRRIVGKISDVKHLLKKNAGPASARNYGAREAAGDILLFIDSDCVAAENWIEKMTRPFAEQSVAAVKGVYKTKQVGLISRLVQVEFEERYSKMARSKGLDFMDFSAGAVRKKLFLELGGFKEDLKMSEDVQFAYKLTNAGHKIVFIKDGAVYHQHPHNFRNYLKVKFWRSYWRMDVYKNYPKKILRDSYTPQTLKLQIAAVFIFLFTLCLWPMVPFAKYIMLAEALIFLLAIAPLTWRAFRRGFIEGITMPFFILGRSLSLGFGIIYYFFEIRNFRELISIIMLALIVVVPSFFTGGRDLIARTFVFILAFPLVFFALRSEKPALQGKIPWKHNLILPLAAFLLVTVISIFFSISPYDGYYQLLHWLSYIIIFFGVFYLIAAVSEAHKIAYLIIMLGVILSLIGIYFFTTTEIFNYLRATSTFYQHNPFAGFLLFVLPLVYSYLFFIKNKKAKIGLILIAILITLVFVLTYSRGSWLSIIIPLGVICWLAGSYRKNWRFIALAVVIVAAAVAVGWWGLNQLKTHQAQVSASENQTSSAINYSIETSEENAVVARLYFWQGAKEIILHNPFIGTGFDTYRIAYRQYLSDIRYYSIDPHNIYLKVLAETGVAGGLAFFWFVGIILLMVFQAMKGLKNIQNNEDKALIAGLGMGLVGSLIHNFVELDWQFPTNLIVFFTVLGVFYKIFLINRQAGISNVNQRDTFLFSKTAKAVIGTVALLVMVGGLIFFYSTNSAESAVQKTDNMELAQAESIYRSALKFDPLNYNLHYGLARTEYLLIPDNKEFYTKEYLDELNKTISSSPGDYQAYEELGLYYLRSKQYTEAEKILEKAVTLNPVGKPVLHRYFAAAYYQSGDKEKARTILEAAAGHYSPEIVNSVIWVVNDRAKILSDISMIQTDLGVIESELGNTDSARRDFQAALEYNPDNALAKEKLMEYSKNQNPQENN
ncbi:MAG: glycosyltransferase [Patescibacteria group bacterium]|jgi:glycosyltransferase involved in cell wall biosynthesis